MQNPYAQANAALADLNAGLAELLAEFDAGREVRRMPVLRTAVVLGPSSVDCGASGLTTPAPFLAETTVVPPPVELNEALSVTAPADDSGAALPEYEGVVEDYSRLPSDDSVRSCYDLFDDFGGGSLDASDRIPCGSVRGGSVHYPSLSVPFFFGHSSVNRPS